MRKKYELVKLLKKNPNEHLEKQVKLQNKSDNFENNFYKLIFLVLMLLIFLYFVVQHTNCNIYCQKIEFVKTLRTKAVEYNYQLCLVCNMSFVIYV